MGIANFETALQGARTRYEASSSTLFNGDTMGTFDLITKEVRQDDGGSYALIDTGQRGIMRQWIGERQRKAFRMYRKDILIHAYEDTMALKRRELIEDTTDAINQKIDSQLSAQAMVFDYKVWESLIANPTGIDGVALFSASHPFGSGGATWSNITADTLSAIAYANGRAAMRALKGEGGRLFGLSPDTLVVGPALEETAKQIVGADRVQPVNAAGALDQTSGNVAAVVRESVYQGSARVIVAEHFADGTHDNDWFLYDSRKGAPPMCLVRQRDPELIERTDMDSPRRFDFDELEWGVEADFGVGGAYPHAVYGKSS